MWTSAFNRIMVSPMMIRSFTFSFILQAMVQYNRIELLNHPVCKKYLAMKWCVSVTITASFLNLYMTEFGLDSNVISFSFPQGCLWEQGSPAQHVFLPVGTVASNSPDSNSKTLYEYHIDRGARNHHGAHIFQKGVGSAESTQTILNTKLFMTWL